MAVTAASIVGDMPCSTTALGVVTTLGQSINTRFLLNNLMFLNDMRVVGVPGCTVYNDPTSGEIDFIEGETCGERNPVQNKFARRQMNLKPAYISKDICKSQYSCSQYSLNTFAMNIADELQNAFVRLLYRALMRDLLTDTEITEDSCDGLKAVTLKEDSVFLTKAKTIDKVDTITADNAMALLLKIASAFEQSYTGVSGVTILAPPGLATALTVALANKNCCSYYDRAGLSIQNMMQINSLTATPLKIITLPESYFKAGAAGYTRIVAFADNQIGYFYNNKHIYNSVISGFSQQVTSLLNLQIMNSVIDYRVIGSPHHTIGVALAMDALVSMRFMRMSQSSVMVLDIKDSILTN